LDRQELISKSADRAIKDAQERWISAISCWELAKLVEKERIGFSIPTITWIRRSLNEHHLKVADLSPEIAVESTLLKGFHKDPADQIIASTSRTLGLPLVTSDRQILEFSEVNTIW
jgi:PIN domain nuclease of toxin-antitoxin system